MFYKAYACTIVLVMFVLIDIYFHELHVQTTSLIYLGVGTLIQTGKPCIICYINPSRGTKVLKNTNNIVYEIYDNLPDI